MLAGLHGSFITGNHSDDRLDIFLERVETWENIINAQRAVELSVKRQFVLKTQRMHFFALWDLSETSQSKRQTRTEAGRFGMPSTYFLFAFTKSFKTYFFVADKRTKYDRYSQTFLTSYASKNKPHSFGMLLLMFYCVTY